MVHGYGGGPPGNDPFGSNPFTNDPFSAPPNAVGAPNVPPGAANPPPKAPRPEVNTLATLSVVFAFVFAPAGAILGHVGLSQIHRTGQAGRDRALVGVTLSYVAIVVAIVMTVVWALTGNEAVAPPTVASTPTTTSVTATTTPTTTSPPAPLPPPPPPTVDAVSQRGLVLPVEEIRAITGDAGSRLIEENDDPYNPTEDGSVFEPADCVPAFLAGTVQLYQGFNYQQYYANIQGNEDTRVQVQQLVTTFATPAAAQSALRTYLEVWARCAGSKLTWSIPGEARRGTYTIGAPQDAGTGITTLRNTYDLNGVPYLHAIAAKNNVLVDVLVSGGNKISDEHVTVARRILERIPG